MRQRKRVLKAPGQPILAHVVGGVGIAIDGDLDPGEARSLAVASDEPAAIILRLTAERADGELRPGGSATIETDSWAAFLDGERVALCLKNARLDGRTVMRVELARDGLDGRFLHADDWPHAIVYPIDQLLVVHALGVGGGALMHAAGICGRDGALLVSGPSGTGKTTMSRACAALGAPILSDERTIVRPAGDGGWLAGGTPWPGEGGFAENRSVPLRGLVVLEQAESDSLVPLSPARALALLYRCHFPPLWDAVAAERTLAHLERLVRDVPAYLFRNRKGADAARRLLELIGGATAPVGDA